MVAVIVPVRVVVVKTKVVLVVEVVNVPEKSDGVPKIITGIVELDTLVYCGVIVGRLP